MEQLVNARKPPEAATDRFKVVLLIFDKFKRFSINIFFCSRNNHGNITTENILYTNLEAYDD